MCLLLHLSFYILFLFTALSVLLRHIHKEKVTVAVDGSLFELHPTIPNMIREFTAHLVPETQVCIKTPDILGLYHNTLPLGSEHSQTQGRGVSHSQMKIY